MSFGFWLRNVTHIPRNRSTSNKDLRNFNTSAVHLSEHDIDGPDDRDHIRNQSAARHQVECLQVHKGRRAHAKAVRMRRAVAHDKVAELSLWRFDGNVHLSRWRLEDLRNFRHDRAGRNAADGLADDADRLAHLLHADHVTVVSVAVLARGNVEIVLLVTGIRLGFAEIPLHARCAEHGTGDADLLALIGRKNADARKPVHPDAILREQILILVQLAEEHVAETVYLPLKAFIQLVLQAADAESVRSEARSAVIFKNLQRFFALAHGVEERRDRSDIQRVSAKPHQMA